jgi:hypothetical protein
MDKLKGIVFLLESLLKSSKRSMFSSKILVDSKEVLQLIEKLNLAINEIGSSPETSTYNAGDVAFSDPGILDVKKEVLKFKQDANDYADSVLSRLQLLVTKMQKNVINMEKNILEGRKLIEQKKMANIKGDLNEA